MARKVITGGKELEATLKRLADKAADRVAKSALGAGLTVLAKAMKNAAPVGETGALKESIGKRNIRNKRKNIHEAKAGINVGKVTKKQKAQGLVRAPHSHLVGLGTDQRSRKSIGGRFSFIKNPTEAQLSTGKGPQNKFVKEATKASLGAVASKMQKQGAKALAREATKAAAKSAKR